MDAMLEEEMIDLVVTEINMPNLDANDFVLIIEENRDRIKFISGLLEMLDFDVVRSIICTVRRCPHLDTDCFGACW